LAASRTRLAAFAALAFATLIWAGNWVMGRGLRDHIDPVSLNFMRWAFAVAVLAPFAFSDAARNFSAIRRDLGVLVLLALTGVTIFHALVYLGLRTTTAVNGVLLNSSLPLFILLVSWILERERATLRQVAGMLLSFSGIVVIMTHGELARLRELEFQSGDAWILLAMPVWGIYSVLVKRCPPELRGAVLTFTLGVIGVAILLPVYFAVAPRGPLRWPTAGEAGAVLYVAVAASVLAFLCWNKGVAVVGANAAGFTIPLLPAFGTVLAIVLLGEAFRAYHAAGFVAILAGVVLASWRPGTKMGP